MLTHSFPFGQTDAVDYYKGKVQNLEDEYEKKTSKQKYAQARNYKDYKSAVWVSTASS